MLEAAGDEEMVALLKAAIDGILAGKDFLTRHTLVTALSTMASFQEKLSILESSMMPHTIEGWLTSWPSGKFGTGLKDGAGGFRLERIGADEV